MGHLLGFPVRVCWQCGKHGELADASQKSLEKWVHSHNVAILFDMGMVRENNTYIQASKYLFVLVKTMCNHIKSVPQIRQSEFIATIWAKMEANDKITAICVNPYTFFCIIYMWLIGLDLYIIIIKCENCHIIWEMLDFVLCMCLSWRKIWRACLHGVINKCCNGVCWQWNVCVWSVWYNTVQFVNILAN